MKTPLTYRKFLLKEHLPLNWRVEDKKLGLTLRGFRQLTDVNNLDCHVDGRSKTYFEKAKDIATTYFASGWDEIVFISRTGYRYVELWGRRNKEIFKDLK